MAPYTCWCTGSGITALGCPTLCTKCLIMLHAFTKEVIAEPDTTSRSFHVPVLQYPTSFGLKINIHSSRRSGGLC